MKKIDDFRLSRAILESLHLQKDTISTRGGTGESYYVGSVEIYEEGKGHRTYSFIIPETPKDGKLRGSYKRVDKERGNSLSYPHCTLEVELEYYPNSICTFSDVILYL